MSEYQVVDGDGFVVSTHPTREEAEREVAATIRQWQADYPTAAKEGNSPRLSVRERGA